MNLLRPIFIAFALSLGAIAPASAQGQSLQRGAELEARGDYEGAFREWMPLAEKGNAVAQYYIGLMFDYGKGVREDDAVGAYWLKRSAEQGHVDALLILGDNYFKGRGVPKNWKESVRLLRLAEASAPHGAKLQLDLIKDALIAYGVDHCLFEEIDKVTGPETRVIVEKFCRSTLEKKSVEWLLRYAD